MQKNKSMHLLLQGWISLLQLFIIRLIIFIMKSIKTLQLIQNAAARVLTGTRKRDHISPVLASLPVKFRIEFKILPLTYKALHGQAPSYLKELIVPYYPTRTLRSLNAGLLVVPIVSKSRTGARAFSYQAPLQWNQLPVVVRRQTPSPHL